MPFSFIGKKILITGAGRGLGRDLAKAISRSGGTVYALGRKKETLNSLANECDNIHPVIADLSNWEETRTAVDKLDAMDGVVNNAVYFPEILLAEALIQPKEVLGQAVQVNLLAPINIIQSTASKMIDERKKGSIVNYSSILGIRPKRGNLHYDVTKAALDMVTKQFAVELGCHQIRVNSVHPTYVDMERIQHDMREDPELERLIKQHTPMGRFCDIQECIDPVMYLLSEHSTMVTGTYNVIDGGLLSSLPF